METILIIEDDASIHQMICDLLDLHHFQHESATSGIEALQINLEHIDLVLLDLMLPGKSGQEIISELKEKKNIPVIVMSAIADIDMKVNLFELGADDYVTKPFDNKELLARIKTRLKRHQDTLYQYQDLSLNIDTYEVYYKNKLLSFSKLEFELLKLFMMNPHQVFTKSYLIEHVWNDEDSADDNTLNVHISNIRSKLKKAGAKDDIIQTIWNVGYKMTSIKKS